MQNLHTTTGRTGVLIFVSVAERYAEILADKAIDERVPRGTWKHIVDDLTDGHRRRAPGRRASSRPSPPSARVLAKHFPPGAQDPNELPDHLIVLQ